MKISSSLLLRRNLLLLVHLMMIFLVAESLRMSPQYHFTFRGESSKSGDPRPIINAKKEGEEKIVGVMKLHATGSSLPDCSHACGPCFPCKRVMVSFKCTAESCPIVYRCMCKGKYYHVPSN
ncbi:hypothetical protein SLEP1_g4774 [Rubroshorea leprosula]|uniref:Epidermal patterning factor-like protein n=1 Tax=Rubroshorea leprosula TaxID=152421 RepID=A0AAV5HVL1_9ROSI|nr:hypothetical protein SLEP1_g4774 [Rubroshorea leprosula]